MPHLRLKVDLYGPNHPYFWLLIGLSQWEAWGAHVAHWQRIRLPVQKMQETRVGSLGGEDPLGKEMATHSGILVWKIPWTEEPGRLLFMGLPRVEHDLVTKPR